MIDLQRLSDGSADTIAFVITVDGEESMKRFKELVFRATNLWPDAPAEIKEFADLIDHGKILQNYKKQDTSEKTIHSSKGETNV